MWVLALSVFIAVSPLQSSTVHLVLLLLDRGLVLTQTASVVSFLAAGAFVGMISSGYFVDQFAAQGVVHVSGRRNSLPRDRRLRRMIRPAVTR